MNKDSKIYIAGHRGMVGSAIWRHLESNGYNNLVGKTSAELDLTNQAKVSKFFAMQQPEYVFLAAARVGGIIANNTYRASFIYQNLLIQSNVIHESYKSGVKKMVYLGSSCIYPKDAPQPIKEDSLLTSELEYTNEPYAISKIAGIKMCESYNLQYGTNFISAMPTNLYGPNDNYDLEKSHVLPALIRKLYLAGCLEKSDMETLRRDLSRKPVEGVDGTVTTEVILNILSKYGIRQEGDKVSVYLWGSGNPRREFLHSDDLAEALVYLMESVDFENVKGTGKEIRNTHINVGFGSDVSIRELANRIKSIVGFQGEILWDRTKPDGTMRKLMDSSKLNAMGWSPIIGLDKGLEKVFQQYID